MEKRKAPLLLLSLLAIALLTATIASPTVNATTKIKIVFDLSHGQGPSTGDWTGYKLEREHANLEGNLTAKGYKVVWATNLDESALADAQFLFLGSVYGKNLTDQEIDVIVDWFRQGEKTIWVAADSDFGTPPPRYIIDNANKVLRAIGSKIRAEPTSLEDPIANCKAAYRPRANVTNKVDSEVAEVVAGVDDKKGVLFHGPTILYGFVNGTAVSLETTKIKNAYWVMKTGASSIIRDNDPGVPPIVHEHGQQGSFVIMAVEKYAGPNGNNKIIVTGENPYGGYQPMFSWVYYGIALDGSKLVMNTVSWGVKVEYEADKVVSDLSREISTLKSTIATQTTKIDALKTEIEGLRSMLYAAIGIAIIGVVVGAVGTLVKRKTVQPTT